jgi:DNA-binding SARP family transcriptional activator
VQLSILGPVLVDGRAPRGAKERALLARLLVAPGTPVPAEALIEAAWLPEARGDVTRSLHVRLAKLRALIGPDRIVREPAGYRLAAAPESVDAHRFAALAAETAHRSPSDALALCDEALALWRGEPFADLVLADDAATVEARRLHTTRDRLRRARAGALSALGRADEAATELTALVAEDPREELVAELMGARQAAGRHAEALDAYRELACRLIDVGLRPCPQIREREAKMLRHADEHEAAPSRATNVGARVTSIVGRDDELAAVTRALRAHRTASRRIEL